MEKGLQKFGFREILEILLPGIYLTSFMLPYKDFVLSINSNNIIINSVSFSLISLLVGLVFYWMDISKKLPFFINNLPTEILIKNHKSIDKIKIINTYFKFYDNSVSKEEKNKTEIYTSFYHFSVNIFIASIVLLVINFCFRDNNYNNLIIIISLLSLINLFGLFFGKRKIKYMFHRQYEKFINSNYYKELIN